MAVLTPWSPPWQTPGGIPSSQATDVEVATAVSAEATARDVAIDAAHLAGTLAARPAFGDDGRFYFATDEGVLYRDSGTAWVRMSLGGGEERGYAQKTNANFVTTGTDNNDITGLDPVTFDVNAGEVAYVRGRSGWNNHSAANGSVLLNIMSEANVLQVSAQSARATANATSVGPIFVEQRITTPGSYTRKLGAQVFSGNGTLACSATLPITLGVYIYR